MNDCTLVPEQYLTKSLQNSKNFCINRSAHFQPEMFCLFGISTQDLHFAAAKTKFCSVFCS